MRYAILLLLTALLPTGAHAQFPLDTVLFDFGGPGPEEEPYHNIITDPSVGSLGGVLTRCGGSSFLRVSIDDDFTGTNRAGSPMAGAADWTMPGGVGDDSFFGSTFEFNGRSNPTAGFSIEVYSETVRLDFFASRLASDNRQTCYRVTGLDTVEVCLQVANNVSDYVTAVVRPDSNYVVGVEVYAGPENDNEFGFFYLGAMRVVHELGPVTTEDIIGLEYPRGGEYFVAGSTVEIEYFGWPGCKGALGFRDGDAGAIDVIARPLLGRERFRWTVPDTVTDDARVLFDFGVPPPQFGWYKSSRPFSIGRDTQRCRVVVLGSSTAAGTGPSTQDSAWVWRLRRSLARNDNRIEVVNLARGGYNTYKLLPDDGTVPPDINETIDSARNISAALALDPQVIIINLPSNDAARGYSVAQQLENYRQILDPARAAGVPVYVTTPQPRNFDDAAVAIQRELLDSTLARFGSRAIDFWTPFVDSSGRVDPAFDSGDGVHLNDAAHRIMWQQVLAKALDAELTCQRPSGTEQPTANPALVALRPTPNPASARVTFAELPTLTDGPAQLLLFDAGGALVRSRDVDYVAGANRLTVTTDDLPSGTYRAILRSRGRAAAGGTFVIAHP